MHGLRAYILTLLAILVLDGLWLTTVGGPLFVRELGSLLRPAPNLGAAAGFYLLYAAGVTLLAVLPTTGESRPWPAAWRGAMLGCTAYATFDLTNLAIVAGWSPLAALVDLVWGTTLTTVVASIGWWSSARSTPVAGGAR